LWNIRGRAERNDNVFEAQERLDRWMRESVVEVVKTERYGVIGMTPL